ncbi:deleted in malignant brain tumors 1 protein-like [Strongylocentrotus purpuratus]|uniref:Scavenger receptor cysteine-rich protein n=1 Tax=Strongylocentrotus purpuratus TaxID=7668 RepID=A0A7M7PJD0_STRPU|nr:deleted in malignant brain tumors 1 protein-like [Strongylocentrotus purpuratus]
MPGEICPAGTFGDYCMKNCTCVDGANCSNVDGSCSCEPAFERAVCDRSEVKVTANRPSNDTISKGNDFTLACQVNLAGIDLDEVASYRDSDKLPDTTDLEYRVDSNPDMGMYYITIRGAGAEDTGAYRCTAVTKGERFISSSEDILLDVVVLGKIDDDLSRSKDYVQLNGTASLNCTVFSSSETSIAWERNGVQLVDGMNRTSIEPSQEMETGRTYFFSVLKISDITQEEDGIYKCLAFNGAGIMTDSEIFNIFVQVRLVSGSNDTEGRVEVMYNGSWGTICDTRWDLRDARVVCRMLGFDGALGAPGSATFGQGSGCIHLYDVGCDGTEDNLAVCAHTGSQRYSCNHTSDAGVVCYSGDPFHVRLTNGTTDSKGRVEVFNNGRWGTICDNNWDLRDARVVCKILGFDGALAAPGSATFGAGSGKIFVDDVRCKGSEDTLAECNHRGLGVNNCDHDSDADPFQVRLVNGSNDAEGRVEVMYDGSWGTICDDWWDLKDAKVVCRMLGFNEALAAPISARFGQGPGQIRLVNGADGYEGRVEILHEGSWGTVCDDLWDLDDAKVVCRQLEFDGALAALPQSRFGQGSGDIFLDGVQCNGTETNLKDCKHKGIGVHYCYHKEDASVICRHGDPFEIRLVDGSNDTEGMIEIMYDGSWGTICDNTWDMTDARVVCRMLGFDGSLGAPVSASFGQGSGRILLDYVNCEGTEDNLADCDHSGFGDYTCQYSGNEMPGVICYSGDPFQVRRVGGSNDAEGRVEVMYDGSWGTICDDWWDVKDAKVVCRKLGFDGALDAPRSARFGQGYGRILLAYVDCEGTEDCLAECAHDGVGNYTSCGHARDAGVICYSGARVVCRMLGFDGALEPLGSARSGQGFGRILLDWVACDGTEDNLAECFHGGIGHYTSCEIPRDAGVICYSGAHPQPFQVRLVGGSNDAEGRVELMHDGSWGTICDDDWDLRDAKVVCRMLGFDGALDAPGSARFGQGSGRIPLKYVNCEGTEDNLADCAYVGIERDPCSHARDVGAVCYSGTHPIPFQVRLIVGSNDAEGRVEVLYDGSWGTICDTKWDLRDARVVCRMLGFDGALEAPGSARFGQGSGRILLNDVGCDGTEDNLAVCAHAGIQRYSCSHTSDAGAVCYSGAAPGSATFGAGSGKILFDDVGCKGTEDTLAECYHRGLGVNNCKHDSDAGVFCFKEECWGLTTQWLHLFLQGLVKDLAKAFLHMLFVGEQKITWPIVFTQV